MHICCPIEICDRLFLIAWNTDSAEWPVETHWQTETLRTLKRPPAVWNATWDCSLLIAGSISRLALSTSQSEHGRASNINSSNIQQYLNAAKNDVRDFEIVSRFRGSTHATLAGFLMEKRMKDHRVSLKQQIISEMKKLNTAITGLFFHLSFHFSHSPEREADLYEKRSINDLTWWTSQ